MPHSLYYIGWIILPILTETISPRTIRALALTIATALAMNGFGQTACLSQAAVSGSPATGAPLGQAPHSHPFLFMENLGQVRNQNGNAVPEVLFVGKGTGCKVFLRADGLTYQFEKTESRGSGPQPKFVDTGTQSSTSEAPSVSTHRMDMRLLDANASPRVVRKNENAYRENFYNLPAFPDGLAGVRSFEKIQLEDVYPHIDWVIYTAEKGIKYDFVIHPGADPTQIKMDYSWAEGVILNSDGSLTLTTPLGEIREDAPVCFQEGREVQGSFVVEGNTVGIRLMGYDPGKTCIFDPGIVWATYYGSLGNDIAYSTTVDASGNVFLSGLTSSTNVIASGGFQDSLGGGDDAFLVKFSPSGARLWGTYYGGPNYDRAESVIADASGSVYIAGRTQSTSGIASGGFQNTYGGGTYDAFLVKFSSSGSRIWATYYGGGALDYGLATTVDPSGNVFLSGQSASASGIASGGFQNTYGGGSYDAFLVKFSSSGARTWATYYGGTGIDYGYYTTTDASGNVFMSGRTYSSTGIGSGGFQNTFGGGQDAYLVKFNAAGSRLWGTYYGGTNIDAGYSIAVASTGDVYLAGHTLSATNIASGGFQNTINTQYDSFLAKFSSSGSRLWATYYGGPGADFGWSTSVDATGNVFLAGYTTSTSGIASGGFQNIHGGSLNDVFLAKFTSAGLRTYATYYGGQFDDECYSTAVDAAGNIYLAGYTQSGNGIAYGGFQMTQADYVDAILAKVADVVSNQAPAAVCQNLTLSANGSCEGIALASQFDGGSSDPNNDPISFAASPPGPYALGQTTVVVNVSDGSLGSTCSAIVTVIDTAAPIAICQSLSLVLDAQGNASTTASAIDNGSSDNCGPLTLLLSQAQFTCANVGPNNLILTATDGSGNSSTCSALVVITAQPVTINATADTTSCGFHVSCNGALDGSATVTATGGCPGYSYLWSNGQSSATATGLGAGSASVTVTDASGATSVATVSLLAPPPLQIALGTLIASCPNDSTGSATILPSGGNSCGTISYLWSNGAATQTMSSIPGGNYTVTVTDAQGCTAMQNVIVSSFPQPLPTFVQLGNDLTAGQTWASYQWLLNGSPISGATANMFTIIVSGSYSLQVTDSNGCTGTSSVSTITGIEESIPELHLSLHPNPSNGEFHLRTESPLTCTVLVDLYDAYGKRILSETLPSLDREATFDIGSVAAGVYWVKVSPEANLPRCLRLVVY